MPGRFNAVSSATSDELEITNAELAKPTRECSEVNGANLAG
jgi:hypothetical protein